MRRILLFLALLFSYVCPAQQPPSLRQEEARQDWKFLTTQLFQIHPDPYRYEDSVRIHAFPDSLYHSLDGELSYLQFYAQLKLLLGALRDGHLASALPPDVEEYYEKQVRVFPLGLKFHGRYGFVSCNAGSFIPVGREVLSINRHSMREIRQRLYPFISADGTDTTRRDWILGRNFWFYYLMAYGQQDSFVITSHAMEEPESYAPIKAVPSRQNPCFNADTSSAPLLALKWMSQRTAILTIRSFNVGELKEKGFDFQAFLLESFQAIRKERILNLIIDIRDNGGGKDEYGWLLYSYLADKPFRYYQSLRTRNRELTAKENPGLAVHHPAKHRFRGKKVYLVTNGGTFSAASEFCSIVKSNKRGVLIGEETGSGYSGNNSGRMEGITLPASRISVSIPTVKYVMAISDTGRIDGGVVPDIYVPVWTYHYEKKRDRLLEAAINLTRPR